MRLFIVFKNPQATSPGACHAGLGVTASNQAEYLTEHGIDASAVPVVDGYDIQARLARDPKWVGVTHLAMCAPFFDTVFLTKLCAQFPRVQFTVIYHSNVGFLGVDVWSTGVLGEQIALEQKIRNFRVSCNSAKFCLAVTRAWGTPCTVLPNLYYLAGPVERARAPWTAASGTLRIGAFGATRVLKNIVTAAWAAAIIGRTLSTKVEFWVSSGRPEGPGADSVLKTIGRFLAHQPQVTMVASPWQPWQDFRRTTMRSMHLVLQPSFTESFNNVTADAIAEGVPATTGIALLRDRNQAADGYAALVAHNVAALGAWRAFL